VLEPCLEGAVHEGLDLCVFLDLAEDERLVVADERRQALTSSGDEQASR